MGYNGKTHTYTHTNSNTYICIEIKMNSQALK